MRLKQGAMGAVFAAAGLEALRAVLIAAMAWDTAGILAEHGIYWAWAKLLGHAPALLAPPAAWIWLRKRDRWALAVLLLAAGRYLLQAVTVGGFDTPVPGWILSVEWYAIWLATAAMVQVRAPALALIAALLATAAMGVHLWVPLVLAVIPAQMILVGLMVRRSAPSPSP